MAKRSNNQKVAPPKQKESTPMVTQPDTQSQKESPAVAYHHIYKAPGFKFQFRTSPVFSMQHALQEWGVKTPEGDFLFLTRQEIDNTMVNVYTQDYLHPYIPTFNETRQYRFVLFAQPTLKQLGYTLDSMSALRYQGIGARKKTEHKAFCTYEYIREAIEHAEKRAAYQASYGAFKAQWDTHVEGWQKAKNAEKAARDAAKAEGARLAAERRALRQAELDLLKADREAKKAAARERRLERKEDLGWLAAYPWLKDSAYWQFRRNEDAGEWGPVTTEIDIVLAEKNRVIRVAKAYKKAERDVSRSREKARRKRLEGVDAASVAKPNGKQKTWDKGEKRALKSLLRRQRKAVGKTVVVKMTKQVTRIAPWTAENEAQRKALLFAAIVAKNTAVSLRADADRLVNEPEALNAALAVQGKRVKGLIADLRKALAAVEKAEKAVLDIQKREAEMFMDIKEQIAQANAAGMMLGYVFGKGETAAAKVQDILHRVDTLLGINVVMEKREQQQKLVPAQVKKANLQLNEANEKLDLIAAEMHRAFSYIAKLVKARVEAGVAAKHVEASLDEWMADIDNRVAHLIVQRNSLNNSRKTETVTVSYYKTVTKKSLKASKKASVVTVGMGTLKTDLVSSVEVSMGKLSATVAGTVSVAVKANA